MATRLVKRARKAPAETSKDPLQRARDNYPRRVSLPVSMAHAMNALLDETRKLNKSRRARLQGALAIALGDIPGLENVGEAAQIVNVDKSGVVHIAVSGSTLAHELGVVYKTALLNKLRELLHGNDSLAGIVVKAGTRAKTPGRARKE